MDLATGLLSGRAIDPITLEVVRHGIVSVCNQIDANITRTAFSPYIYEYKDYAVGLVGPDGALVAQNTGGMPIFVADSVGAAVRDGLATYGAERLRPGDVVLCNHAAVQGQHLNNTVMYTPIHAGPNQDRLVGFFAINVHWIDIGGSVPRSTDIFMEGLQLRSIKLWSQGRKIEEIYRIIESNTRFPQELMGDIAAQLAGCLLGRDLVRTLVDKYGADTYLDAVATILGQSEAAARAEIAAMPDGVYEADSILDGDGDSDRKLPIRIVVTIAGDRMSVDFTGLPPQVPGCINAGYYGGGQTVARVAFKYLVAPHEPANEGTFRPLSLVLPEGTLLSASPTAPMGNYSRAFPTVIDTILRALQQAAPDRATGGHFASFAVLRLSGRGRDGSFYDCIDCGHGGWGAGADHDGGGPFRTMAHGDTRTIPVELQESIYPFRIDAFALRPDSGGAGTFRGGLGYRKSYRILEPCNARIDFDRIACPPWGVLGGGDAQPGWVVVVKPNGDEETVYKAKSYALNPGDQIRMEVGGGGGYGPPAHRAPDALRRDLVRGYVTPEAAERDFGPALTAAAR